MNEDQIHRYRVGLNRAYQEIYRLCEELGEPDRAQQFVNSQMLRMHPLSVMIIEKPLDSLNL